VKEGTNNGNPTTGDAMGSQMALFVGMMVLSAAGIVMLTAAKARKMR
jgi:hypothetical protein